MMDWQGKNISKYPLQVHMKFEKIYSCTISTFYRTCQVWYWIPLCDSWIFPTMQHFQ